LPVTGTENLIICPGQLVLQEGKPTSLEVDVTGQPVPAVSWFCDSEPIPADNFHKVSGRTDVREISTLSTSFTLALNTLKCNQFRITN
jgi:hypothetical protein